MSQGRRNDAQRTVWIYYGIALVFWAATILPSTSIKGWFYLDEPTQLVTAMQGGWIGAPDLMMGRYLPVFQAYRKLVYTCVGASPAGFYFCQSLLFLSVLFLAVWLIRRVAGKSPLPQLLAVFGLMSYSLAEPAYTLGKHEPVLVLLLMFYLCALQRLEADPAPGARARTRWGAAAACLVLCALAMWNKETTPAFVAFILPLMALPSERLGLRLRRFGPALLASLAGILIAKTPVWIAQSSAPVVTAEVYAKFKPTAQSIAANARYYLDQAPDFFVVMGLALLLLGIGFKRHRATVPYRFAAGAALAALCYLGGLLLWRWGSVYYSYPPQWLAALAFVTASAALLADGGARRNWAGAACGGFILAKLAALVPFIYISNVQRIEAEVYSRAVRAFAAQPGAQQSAGDVRLYFENWSLISEQPVQTQLYLENILGTKARVLGGAEFVSGVPANRAAAAALFHMENIAPWDERIRPRAGDYVITFSEHFPGRYNSRAVSPCVYQGPRFASVTGIRWSRVSSFTRKLACPVALAKALHAKPIGSRYELHRIDSVAGAGVWTGRWGDGWVGEKAAFFPFSETNGTARLKISPYEKATPNEVAVVVNEAVRSRWQIADPQPLVLSVPTGGPLELRFGKAVSPGKDPRCLSAKVEWVPGTVQ